MDDLRWILLGVAVVVIAAVYFFSRSRNKKDSFYSPLDAANDVPSFSVDDDLNNDWRDGVGPVRVVSSVEPDNISPSQIDDIAAVADNLDEPVVAKVVQAKTPEKENRVAEIDTQEAKSKEAGLSQNNASKSVAGEKTAEETRVPERKETPEPGTANSADTNAAALDDVISVYVLAPKGEVLKGEKILSAAYALHLQHGDMKIFHRHAETAKREIQFSMASIKEPGWFDVEQMNQIETPGVSFFMQVNLVEKPSRVLDDMLICAHSLSTMLGASLCNAQRKLLDEAYTNELREKVKRLEAIKEQSA